MQKMTPSLLLLAMAASVSAQQPADLDLEESVAVRVVNVDVVVTNKKGRPVTGLTRDDFILKEDGREVEISNFFAYSGAVADEAREWTESDAPERPLAEPLTLAVYLDRYNTRPANLERVLDDVQAFVAGGSLGPTRLVVATFLDRLEIRHTVAGELEEALREIAEAKASTRGMNASMERSQTIDRITSSYEVCAAIPRCSVCLDNWEEMLGFASRYAQSEQTRAAVSVAGMADLVGALAGIDGRKLVLYVGDGFQQRGGISMLSYVGDICEGIQVQARNEVMRNVSEYDSTTRFNQLAAYANGNRVTFYMLDTGGLRAMAGVGVEFGTSQLRASAEIDSMRIANIQNTHFIVSNETGGTAILNANRPLEALEKVGLQLREGSYSLGFVPDRPPTGRVHLLSLDLAPKARKSREIRYRRSYQDKKLEAQLVDQLISAIFLERVDNPLGVRIEASESRPLGRKSHDVSVVIAAPEDAFELLPNASGQRGKARLWLGAVGEDGDRTNLRQQMVDLGAGGLKPEGGAYFFVVDMTLREGEHTIAVGVRDEVTTRQSIVRAEITVPVGAAEESASE